MTKNEEMDDLKKQAEEARQALNRIEAKMRGLEADSKK
jgi:hypothetical protein